MPKKCPLILLAPSVLLLSPLAAVAFFDWCVQKEAPISISPKAHKCFASSRDKVGFDCAKWDIWWKGEKIVYYLQPELRVRAGSRAERTGRHREAEHGNAEFGPLQLSRDCGVPGHSV